IQDKEKMSRIAIIGAGAWGTALAIVAGRKNRHQVRLWAYEVEAREAIARTHVNSLFLPGYNIPDGVSVTGDFGEALERAEIVITAIPSQHCRRILQQMVPHLRPEALLVSAAKGLEQSTLLRMSQVIGEVTKGSVPVGALSGPTFAAEVARGDPTAITVASVNAELMTTVQRELTDIAFRVYSND